MLERNIKSDFITRIAEKGDEYYYEGLCEGYLISYIDYLRSIIRKDPEITVSVKADSLRADIIHLLKMNPSMRPETLIRHLVAETEYEFFY